MAANDTTIDTPKETPFETYSDTIIAALKYLNDNYGRGEFVSVYYENEGRGSFVRRPYGCKPERRNYTVRFNFDDDSVTVYALGHQRTEKRCHHPADRVHRWTANDIMGRKHCAMCFDCSKTWIENV